GSGPDRVCPDSAWALCCPRGWFRQAVDRPCRSIRQCGSMSRGVNSTCEARCLQTLWQDRNRLEQAAHGIWTGKALHGQGYAFSRGIIGPGSQPAGALEQAHSQQEISLRRQMRSKPAAPRYGCQRREIDMGREVRLARTGEYILISMGADRLERVAHSRFKMAVVQEQACS